MVCLIEKKTKHHQALQRLMMERNLRMSTNRTDVRDRETICTEKITASAARVFFLAAIALAISLASCYINMSFVAHLVLLLASIFLMVAADYSKNTIAQLHGAADNIFFAIVAVWIWAALLNMNILTSTHV